MHPYCPKPSRRAGKSPTWHLTRRNGPGRRTERPFPSRGKCGGAMPFGPASHEKPASINQVLIESTLVIPRSPPRRTARNPFFSPTFPEEKQIPRPPERWRTRDDIRIFFQHPATPPAILPAPQFAAPCPQLGHPGAFRRKPLLPGREPLLPQRPRGLAGNNPPLQPSA